MIFQILGLRGRSEKIFRSVGLFQYNRMARYKVGSKDNLLLFSQSLDEWLSENDEVYGLNELIDRLDIGPIEHKYSPLSSKCFHPRTMIKVLFFGYHKGIFSSRKLAWACRSVLQFI